MALFKFFSWYAVSLKSHRSTITECDVTWLLWIAALPRQYDSGSLASLSPGKAIHDIDIFG